MPDFPHGDDEHPLSMQQSGVCVFDKKCLLIVGEHSNVVDTLGFKVLDLLNKSWDVAGTADRRVCTWNTNNDGLQHVSPAFSNSVSALSRGAEKTPAPAPAAGRGTCSSLLRSARVR